MKKKKRKKTHRPASSISQKVLASAQQLLNSKVINLSQWREASVRAEDYQKTVIGADGLTQLDPVHGVYVYGQNTMSVFVEQLAQLPALSDLTNAYVDAEEEYMPSGPLMSPLTQSYFICWGNFDLCIGEKKETFGSVAIDVCQFLGTDPGLISIFKKMQNSRMGFYLHEGGSGKHVFLRELITNQEIKAYVASGYKGTRGEIWFARIMPPPFEMAPFDYSVVFTTPYLIGEFLNRSRFVPGSEKDWLAYFERNLQKTGIHDDVLAYEFLMRHGLGRHYWNEYIFLGYVNHQRDVIFLAGYPDIPASMPHSP